MRRRRGCPLPFLHLHLRVTPSQTNSLAGDVRRRVLQGLPVSAIAVRYIWQSFEIHCADLLILRLENKTTMAISKGLRPPAGYPLHFFEANFIASGPKFIVGFWRYLSEG